MEGNANQVQMCGTLIELGDEMVIEYTRGNEMKGATIKGTVVELWEVQNPRFRQARLSCGWCFHNYDKIISHIKSSNALRQP